MSTKRTAAERDAPPSTAEPTTAQQQAREKLLAEVAVAFDIDGPLVGCWKAETPVGMGKEEATAWCHSDEREKDGGNCGAVRKMLSEHTPTGCYRGLRSKPQRRLLASNTQDGRFCMHCGFCGCHCKGLCGAGAGAEAAGGGGSGASGGAAHAASTDDCDGGVETHGEAEAREAATMRHAMYRDLAPHLVVLRMPESQKPQQRVTVAEFVHVPELDCRGTNDAGEPHFTIVRVRPSHPIASRAQQRMHQLLICSAADLPASGTVTTFVLYGSCVVRVFVCCPCASQPCVCACRMPTHITTR